jgi:hypothetical protein
MRELTNGGSGGNNGTSNAGGHSPTLPSANNGSMSPNSNAHAAIVVSMKRFERFRLIFNILCIIALIGQGYFGVASVLHPSQPDLPDDDHFNAQAARPMLFHYLQTGGVCLGLWLAWLPLRFGCWPTTTIWCRSRDDPSLHIVT